MLLFASLKDALGPRVAVDVAANATLSELRRALETAHPEIARIGSRARFALNEVWAREEDGVRAGDVVALLPPIAGG